MTGALLDTSVLIEPPADLPATEAAISAMTIAELHKGVLLADDPDQRAGRLRRLATVEATFNALAFDHDAARVFGRYMAEAKRGGHGLAVRDAIIAATAESRGLHVYTRDGDFRRFGVEVTVLSD